MSDKDIIEVVAAHAAGKRIQIRNEKRLTEWTTLIGDPAWNFEQLQYRVEPVVPEPRKPREFIVNIYSDGSVSSTWARRDCPLEQIKVIEEIN